MRRLGSLFLLYFFCLYSGAQNNLAKYVNPFIGTGAHGHTFPGPVLPFGMVQLSPDTRVDGSWDGCSGYHYSDSVIYGFSHTHLSGTGCSDWGDVMLMPMCGKASLDKKIYSSRFSHNNEKASAGYYSVLLDDDKIKVELSATERSGIHRYTFPPGSEANVILDLLHRDKLLKGSVRKVDDYTYTGIRISEAWAREQHCYFAIRFSQPVKKAGLNTTGAIFDFGNKLSEPLIVYVGISGVNEENALTNLVLDANRLKFLGFEGSVRSAEEAWNDQLQKIVVTDNNKERLKIFYTALYHCCIHPSLNSDDNFQYRGRDNEIYPNYGRSHYNVFSLWDTYRALHPLFTVIERNRTEDFIRTFLKMFKESGRLPVWELSSNETDCMIGYHAASVISDAFVKGIGGFDTLAVYNAMKAASNYTGFGIPAYGVKKYLDSEDENESVSRTLEYAYDDWCIAQMAGRLNRVTDYNYYIARAQSWKNVFDIESGFMRPRKNGDWLKPFDPKEVNNHFTEGNSWQYSFYVPQDIESLVEMHGGPGNFERKLDSLFSTGSKTSGRDQADITGLIGQYAHGNEPSHHMAYLYNYIGKPWKSQEKIYQIMNDFYKNSPDGLIGNEDCGQMSAWYVMSAMGIYPVCPGSAQYVLGRPMFDTVRINLENGKKFVITKTGGENKYVKNIQLNGNASNRSVIYHNQILAGGKLNFDLESALSPDNIFGKSKSDRPASRISDKKIIPAPLIKSQGRSFDGSQQISIENNSSINYPVVYTLDGSEPNRNSKVYNGPFTIDQTSVLKAKIYAGNDSSSTLVAKFFRKPNNWEIQLKSKYSPQYSAGGSNALIDGIYGELNWRKGEWQGYQDQDVECVMDLKEKKQFQYFSADFLQDSRAWILFPGKVEIFISDDGKTFRSAGIIVNDIPNSDMRTQTKKFEKQFNGPESGRYIKMVATNAGKMPDWHEGKGGASWLFLDEIEIR